jgi:HK97 family phage prohead protease
METKRLDVTMGQMEGTVTALFARLDTIDRDGDVVVASAFTSGQEVALVWGHRWEDPIGKGLIQVLGDEVRLEGRFFLETARGREAYATVKAMGTLQEWSWGFRATAVRYEPRVGRRVRVITGAEVFEVSPVLVGAGRGTGTLALKSDKQSDPPMTDPALWREWMRFRQAAWRVQI